MSETNSRWGSNSVVACMAGKSEVPRVKSHLGHNFATGFFVFS